jgi:UDP-3-O-[3-hydroxymyristoyl] glucosamine N-acyltransferase
MSFIFSIKQILSFLGEGGHETEGSYAGDVSGIASLSSAQVGDLSFLGNPKYRAEVADSEASVLLLPKDYAGRPKDGQLYIRVENPSFTLALICREIEGLLLPKPPPGVHPTAVIDPRAVVSPEATIGPLCVIGEGAQVGRAILESQVSLGPHAKVGEDSYLFSGVKVGAYCEIGPRNRLLPGCVIGSDGYGYEFIAGAHQRVPQVGRVVTAEDVDIGANTTVDRARFGTTYIGAGTKVDNQVQIAHNVRIGKHCLIVSQVGISGSTELGDGVVLGGQVGVAGHLKIGDGAMIAGGAAVLKSVPPAAKLRGSPAYDMASFNRVTVLQRKLPDLFKRFDQLEKSIESANQT